MNSAFKKIRFSPFIHITPTISSFGILAAVMFVPHLVCLFWYKSFDALIVIAATFFASVLADIAFNLVQKKRIEYDLTVLAQGIIIGLFLPSTYPAVQAFFVVFLGILVAKYFFGPLASSWANPMAVVIIFAWFASPQSFPPFLLTREVLQNGNPALHLFTANVIPLVSFDVPLTETLNRVLFKPLGIVLPNGYLSLLWDTQSIIPAFRFNVLTLFASVVLFSLDMLDSIIPACFLCVYAVLVRLFGLYVDTGLFAQGDMLLALMTSGTLFCAFFLLPWFGTTPLTVTGKIIYGVLAGVVAFLISGCGMSSVGSVFTVLVMNALSPLIQLIEDKWYLFFKARVIAERLENEQ